MCSEGKSATAIKRRKEHLALVESTKEKIYKINTFHNKIVKQWTIPDQRIIGEVVNVAPHSLTHNQGP